MLKRLRAARHHQDGFTLTELLIVIVILGVLAGIVVFAVAGITDRGTKSACQADVRTVMTAVEAFHAENGTYPDITAGEDTDSEGRIQTLIVAKLLRSQPGSDKYVVNVTDSGVVTGTLTAGGNCFD